ncbi:hypothetical protein RBWH47_04800 [Rhodopirellula baltica WH47]|uniref:Uncharacterized protein n=1 Tax=Rhodopirellula baltica WH47 TaxID=991778 RepID=F2AX49_RHOBT|nr:hypothetical protein RBWH47_04800 [Rhodopirellula baltica WH47]
MSLHQMSRLARSRMGPLSSLHSRRRVHYVELRLVSWTLVSQNVFAASHWTVEFMSH